MHKDIVACGVGLPEYFQLHQPEVCSWDWYLFARHRIWWKLDNLAITLTRPSLLDWASRSFRADGHVPGDENEENCRRYCILRARNTVHDIENYMERNTLQSVACWYAL